MDEQIKFSDSSLALDVFWLAPPAHLHGFPEAARPEHFLLLVFSAPAPPGSDIAVIASDADGIFKPFCAAYSRPRDRQSRTHPVVLYPNPRDLSKAMMSDSLRFQVVLLPPGRRAERSAAFALRAPRPEQELEAGGVVAFHGPGKFVNEPAQTRHRDEVLRLRARYFKSDRETVAIVAPAIPPAAAGSPRLLLQIRLPMESMAVAAGSRGGETTASEPFGLTLIPATSAAERAAAGMRIAYANRQSVASRIVGRAIPIRSVIGPDTYWLKEVLPPPYPRRRSFNAPGATPGDYFGLVHGGEDCEIEVHSSYGGPTRRVAVRDLAIFVLSQDGDLLPCDPKTLTPPERQDDPFYSVVENKLKDADLPGEFQRLVSDANATLGALLTFFREDARRRTLLTEFARTIADGPRLLACAARISQLVDPPRSRDVAEALLKLLGDRPGAPEMLFSPILDLVTEPAPKLGLPDFQGSGNRNPFDNHDVLEPIYEAFSRDCNAKDPGTRPPPEYSRQYWRDATMDQAEARIALASLVGREDPAEVLRRLVEAGLTPSLDMELAFEKIEPDVVFAERYLSRARQPSREAARAALVWAAEDVEDFQPSLVTERLLRSRQRGEDQENDPLIAIPDLRAWRARVRAEKLLAEIQHVKARIDADREEGHMALAAPPPLPPNQGGGHLDIQEELDRAAPRARPSWRRLIEQATSWEMASRASLVVTLRAIETVAGWKFPARARLDPRLQEQVTRRVLDFLREPSAIAEANIAAIAPLFERNRYPLQPVYTALRRRARDNAREIKGSFEALAIAIGSAGPETLQAISANANSIAALDLKARLNAFVQRTTRKFKQRFDRLIFQAGRLPARDRDRLYGIVEEFGQEYTVSVQGPLEAIENARSDEALSRLPEFDRLVERAVEMWRALGRESAEIQRQANRRSP